jgi:hypothetical protein
VRSEKDRTSHLEIYKKPNHNRAKRTSKRTQDCFQQMQSFIVHSFLHFAKAKADKYIIL